MRIRRAAGQPGIFFVKNQPVTTVLARSVQYGVYDRISWCKFNILLKIKRK